MWLSGPTGAGKSSLAEVLGSRGWGVVSEFIDPDIFAGFSADPHRYCAALQASIMRSRGSQWAAMNDFRNVVFDRSVGEDFHVFCQLHSSSGLLSADAMDDLRAISEDVSANTPEPDLILYLNPGDAVLEGRVTSGHPSAITDTLASQISLYEKWILSRQDSIVRIDNSRCKMDAMTAFLECM
ncbi:deoxynucleoside kinase [Devosia sp.]|uniref:deoxynucleoside kinase n=1 Tax=Devosia sp. TaxID=1871048 RepID=UPI0026084642|nr:deoxynucleoside kinase [Devosia sp.]